MRYKYCLPIIQESDDEVQKIISENLDDFDYYEVWLDYIEKLDFSFVDRLAKQLGERLVIVFRRQHLEKIRMPSEKRKGILEMLRSTAVLVDLDIGQQADELRHAKMLGLRTIASYHDYNQTPTDVQLAAVVAKMERYSPAIYKLATMCKSQEDSLRLLQLLIKLKAQGKAVVVLGMGELGASSRVLGTLWGNEMTFAPVTDAGKSAPGQLTKEQMETIFKELGY